MATVTRRICFIGDSFVNGTGDPTCLGWAGRVCQTANKQGHAITYYNLGIRRETSADIKARWHQELMRRLPNPQEGRIVFSFGTNDTTIEKTSTRIALDASIQNASDILSAAQHNFPVLMVSPAPIADHPQNERTAKLSTQFAEVCQELAVPYLDVFSPLQQSQIWMHEVAENDGAHPFAAGYQVYADLVDGWAAWVNWFC